tara:strand:- start:477 stop:665 length:189 start_codon:yes stop_codon:yes gene_type:complete
MINNNLEGNKMKELQKRIETVKAHLMIAKLHNNEARIAQFKDELEVLTNTTIITELDNIWGA